MNKQLQKLLLAEFEPGKRESGGFYSPSNLSKINRFRLWAGNDEHGYFVYVWDEEQQKHVRRWVE